jgi:hypothetical protein
MGPGLNTMADTTSRLESAPWETRCHDTLLPGVPDGHRDAATYPEIGLATLGRRCPYSGPRLRSNARSGSASADRPRESGRRGVPRGARCPRKSLLLGAAAEVVGVLIEPSREWAMAARPRTLPAGVDRRPRLSREHHARRPHEGGPARAGARPARGRVRRRDVCRLLNDLDPTPRSTTS